MKVEFWGAAQTVTGSMHLIHHNGKKILLDCGLYQGRRKEAFERNRSLPFDAKEVDFVIVSPCPYRHTGNLPSLVKSGYRGPIYSTSATRDLASFMLLDSAKIQTNDVKYVNKKRKKKNQQPFHPLYETHDAVNTLKLFETVEYKTPFQVTTGVNVTFHFAGHMLGAAVVEIVLDSETPGGKTDSIGFQWRRWSTRHADLARP